jgi:hypothetical protein
MLVVLVLVLDLTPKPDWFPNIRDSMWADHIPAPAPDQRGRWAVVVLAIMKPLTEQEIRAAFVNCTRARRSACPSRATWPTGSGTTWTISAGEILRPPTAPTW